ncbi:Bpu10I restriction endonuclease [Saprospira grandis DSM 2844]|uniref:Bpu10I restriction endonuclease n=1 Tax=Saprospira grandis DSM 2844 TaxID=694433 RepID=J1I0Q4_9BACT|nr:Bpu10I family restriction endonuclease [Saprospira grandis]EJF51843.1 Bpu10I restriction endonuclease [Saprospira grandis DSM 2844]
MELPKPHYDKLVALKRNAKLPVSEMPRVEKAIETYNDWIKKMSEVEGDRPKIIKGLVDLLNEYKYFIDFELIFSSNDDFLYRQKGQLKLDNTVIEEFLPILVQKAFPELNDQIELGPRKCFSAVYFKSSLTSSQNGGGIKIRTKDQDFAIARKIHLRASHSSDFEKYESNEAHLGYLTAECKTNLDKTMFQEANATASDVRRAIPGAKYFLLCEWLDMTPVSTIPTDIEEVLILRKAKRLSSNVRKDFATKEGRKGASARFSRFLKKNPFSADVFSRFCKNIEELIENEDKEEGNVLKDGFF